MEPLQKSRRTNSVNLNITCSIYRAHLVDFFFPLSCMSVGILKLSCCQVFVSKYVGWAANHGSLCTGRHKPGRDLEEKSFVVLSWNGRYQNEI